MTRTQSDNGHHQARSRSGAAPHPPARRMKRLAPPDQSPRAMARLFISHRRKDSSGHAQTLHEGLPQGFP